MPAWMIFREAKRVEILSHCDDRMQFVILSIGWGRETFFDDLTGYGNWMTPLNLESARKERKN